MTCFMALGWDFPTHIFDLHTAYLAASNFLLPYEPTRCGRSRQAPADACRAYGIEGWERYRQRDDQRGHRRRHLARVGTARKKIFNYCEEDVRKAVQLLRAQLLDPAAAGRHRPRAALVELQRQGDRAHPGARHADRHALWNLVQENKAAVVGELIRQFDPSHGSPYPIYTQKANGPTSALNAGSLAQSAF